MGLFVCCRKKSMIAPPARQAPMIHGVQSCCVATCEATEVASSACCGATGIAELRNDSLLARSSSSTRSSLAILGAAINAASLSRCFLQNTLDNTWRQEDSYDSHARLSFPVSGSIIFCQKIWIEWYKYTAEVTGVILLHIGASHKGLSGAAKRTLRQASSALRLVVEHPGKNRNMTISVVTLLLVAAREWLMPQQTPKHHWAECDSYSNKGHFFFLMGLCFLLLLAAALRGDYLSMS